jgi:hypothetical protein
METAASDQALAPAKPGRGESQGSATDALFLNEGMEDVLLGQAPSQRPKLETYLIVLALVGGVLLGWLVIGWWAWPVQWTNVAPPDLQTAYQKRFVELVAAEYWQSKDAAQAQQDLRSWDPQELADLLAVMSSEAKSPQARQQLEALAQALALPSAEPSLWSSLLGQRAILWSIVFAALVLGAALVLAVLPRALRTVRKRESVDEQDSLAESAANGEPALEPWMEAFKVAEEEAAAESEVGQEAEGNAQDEQPRSESAMKAFTETKSDAEEKIDLQDLAEDQSALSSLFGDAGTMDPRLEALTRMVEDVDIASLVRQSLEIVDQLHYMNGTRGIWS